MGKATVVENVGEGLYRIRPEYDLDRIQAELADIAIRDAAYATELAAATKTLAQLLSGKDEAEEAMNEVVQQWKAGLIVGGPPGGPGQTPPDFPDEGPPGVDPDVHMANELFAAINAARSAAGVPVLSRDQDLDSAIDWALEQLANAKSTTDTYWVPEARAVNAGYSYDADVGVSQLMAFGQTSNDSAVAYWLRITRYREALLSEDMDDVGVAAHYRALAPYAYSRGLLLATPGPTSTVKWPEQDPADEAAEESDDALAKIEPPRTESTEPDNVQAAIVTYRLAVLAYAAAEKAVARIKLEAAARDKRRLQLEDLVAAAQTIIYAWCCEFVDDFQAGMAVTTAEIPGWYRPYPVQERITEMGTRDDPDDEIAAYYVSYQERAINIVKESNAGKLAHSEGLNDAMSFYNAAMEPGWLKWKPLWRYGIVTAKDPITSLCSVSLESIVARSIDNGEVALLIDDITTLTGVPIVAACGYRIEVDTAVLIQFSGQDRAIPQIVGWRREPLPCEAFVGRIGWREV